MWGSQGAGSPDPAAPRALGWRQAQGSPERLTPCPRGAVGQQEGVQLLCPQLRQGKQKVRRKSDRAGKLPPCLGKGLVLLKGHAGFRDRRAAWSPPGVGEHKAL